MSIEIEGIEELNAKLSELAKISKEAATNELADIALDLASKCSEAAPTDLGDLRGDIANPRKKGKLDWEIGSDLIYCATQHEHTEFNHPKGGGANFIERPFNENKDRYIEEIGNAIMRELE